jgi:hypothetical protein
MASGACSSDRGGAFAPEGPKAEWSQHATARMRTQIGAGAQAEPIAAHIQGQQSWRKTLSAEVELLHHTLSRYLGQPVRLMRLNPKP